MSKIIIVADHREQNAACLAYLKQHEAVKLEIKTLLTGDYQIGGWVIERKTLSDMATSLVTGRLFTQASRLAAKRQAIFLVEGQPESIGQHGVSRASLQGAIVTLTLIYGIPVLYALDPKETALLILYMAQQVQNFKKQEIIRYGYRPKSKLKRQLYILQGLPGIGVKRAKQLLSEFGNIRSVMGANIEALQAIKGIGKKQAEHIIEIVG